MEPDDATLVWACRRGDAAAWDALVARYQVLIIAIARRSGLTAEQADDLFQRVFTVLIAHLDRLDQPAQVGAWLSVTARREAWHMRRRERARDESSDAAAWVRSLADGGPLPPDQVLLIEEQQRVRAAVAMLDPRCRQIVQRLYYQQPPPTYAQVAAELGVSVGSIGPTRARCLDKLRALLAENDDAMYF